MHTQPVSFTEVPRKAVCSQHPVRICGLNAGKLKHLESQQYQFSSSLPPPTAGKDANYVLGTVLYMRDTTGSRPRKLQAQEATMTEKHTVQGLIGSVMSYMTTVGGGRRRHMLQAQHPCL